MRKYFIDEEEQDYFGNGAMRELVDEEYDWEADLQEEIFQRVLREEEEE